MVMFTLKHMFTDAYGSTKVSVCAVHISAKEIRVAKIVRGSDPFCKRLCVCDRSTTQSPIIDIVGIYSKCDHRYRM